MHTIASIRELFDYQEWAHERIFTALRQLSDEQYTRTLVSSYPTIRETMSHMMFAEWLWLERMKGQSPTAQPDWTTDPSVATLDAKGRETASERRALLDVLSDAAVNAPLDYRNMKGVSSTNLLADVLIHVVNHTTYHRGQVVTMMRQVGGVPPNTDYIAYRRESTR